MKEPSQRAEAIFKAALSLPPEQLAAYLHKACGDDSELLKRVEALLQAPTQTSGLLENAAPTVSGSTIVLNLPVAEKPGDRIGRYKLLQQIGEGGCGVVYMAEQQEPVKRRVALKVIKPGMDTRQVLARFEAERQVLALMDHPNIAKVLDAGATDAGRPFFVMELVRGVKITEYSDDPQNNLSTRQRLELFIQVCRAIQHAHQKGIIHRDIKPSNILVTLQEDGAPTPKIIDFGIAKATAGQTLTDKTLFTAFEQFIGTPAYMSPEQAAMTAVDIDTRSDIYSLGVLLYELLTGNTPFDSKRLFAAGLEEIRRIIREEDPPRPSTRISTLDAVEKTTIAKRRSSEPTKLPGLIRGDLDWIVMKTLEKDRTRRYETANELGMDIERHLNNEPVVARPPSNLYRFQKLVRRNKLAFAAAGAIVLALLLGVVVSAWQATRATRAEGEQRRLREDAQVSRGKAESAEMNALTEAKRAEASAEAARAALSASDFLEGIRLIAEDNKNDALTYFARALSANPTNAAAATRLATLLMYDRWLLPTFTRISQHRGGASAGAFSPDGTRVLIVSSNKTAQVWDTQTGQLLIGHLPHEAGLRSAEFSPDGRWIVTVSTNYARVWDAETGQPRTEPLRHEGWVWSAQFSPEGKRVLTVCSDVNALVSNVRVWDAESGRPLTIPLKHDGGGPRLHLVSARFCADGRRLLTHLNSTARVWDADTGELLLGPLAVASAPISPSGTAFRPMGGVSISPDGNWLATWSSSRDKEVRIWDLRNGQVQQPLRFESAVNSVAFDFAGKRVVTGCSDQTARVWDVLTGKPLTELLKHDASVSSCEFSPLGDFVLTLCADGTARVWDAANGQPRTKPFALASRSSLVRAGLALDAAPGVRFSPNGRWLATMSADTLQLWDALSGQLLAEGGKFTTAGNDAPKIQSLQFSRDGRRIVAIGSDWVSTIRRSTSNGDYTFPRRLAADPPGSMPKDSAPNGGSNEWTSVVGVWDSANSPALAPPLKSWGQVSSAQFSPDGTRIVTASAEGMGRVWDAQTGQPLTAPLKHSGPVNSAQFSPDGNRVVTASGDNTARVWDAQSGQPLTAPLKHSGPVNAAQFSPDGKWVVTASGDKTARVWDAQSGQPLTAPLQHSERVNAAQFSPDGTRLLTSGFSAIFIWNALTGQKLAGPLNGWGGSRARFSPDGKRVVMGSSLMGARIWDVESGQPLPEQLPIKGNLLDFSPDGKRTLTASPRGPAQVSDTQTGHPLTGPLKHDGTLNSAHFSADGQRIVISGGNNVRVWDADSGQPLTELLKHEGPVKSAQFSPDGKRIITLTSEGVARLWDLAPSIGTCPVWLAQLAEAVSGQALNSRSVLEPTKLSRAEILAQIRGRLEKTGQNDDWVVWGRWFLAAPSTRTISPFSKLTVPEYIEHRITENTVESLAEAEHLAFGNTNLFARISQARAKLAQTK